MIISALLCSVQSAQQVITPLAASLPTPARALCSQPGSSRSASGAHERAPGKPRALTQLTGICVCGALRVSRMLANVGRGRGCCFPAVCWWDAWSLRRRWPTAARAAQSEDPAAERCCAQFSGCGRGTPGARETSTLIQWPCFPCDDGRAAGAQVRASTKTGW